jgi:hypothetical protein
MRHISLGILAAVLTVVMSVPAQADPPVTGTCTYTAGVVSGAGLPTGTVINFFVTDASGRTGEVLGYAAADGTASVGMPVPTGPTTYDFGSVTRGPADDYKFWVYAECVAG